MRGVARLASVERVRYMARVSRVLVHLVRHGEVENPDRLRYGRLPGFRLSANGREQAARAAAYLARQTPAVTRIVSGPLERARETADAIARGLSVEDVRVDDRVTEAASRFDGLPRAFAPHLYLWRHAETLTGSAHERPFAVATRVRDALVDLAAHAARDGVGAIAVVSHQLPIQYVRELLLATEPAARFERLRWQLGWVPKARCGHASITSVTFEGERVVGVDYAEP